MNSSAPRIAIPEPTSTDQAYNQRSLPQYIHAIEASGGVAVPIALTASAPTQESLLGSCSAILLPGSPADVDPTRYGQEAVAACADKDELRELTDNLLLSNAFAHGKPVFGICFGLQFLNAWKGGTLLQDLAKFPLAAVNHEPGREIQQAHPIEVAPNSRLAQVLSFCSTSLPCMVKVNSSHHQAIELAGEGLLIVARSPEDGVVEAIEGVNTEHFVLGVQWHPERTYDANADSRALFTAFLDAARAWATARP